ncbi:MAG: PH domain-containing protein [Actinomycetota bacterium]
MSAGCAVVLFGTLTVLLPGAGIRGWDAIDSALFAAFGAGMTWLLWRYATVRAIPTTAHLSVRNLLVTRQVRWLDITAVRFADGDPWVTLLMQDGDDVPVMAIQRADRESATQEVSRLVALHQTWGASHAAPGGSPEIDS